MKKKIYISLLLVIGILAIVLIGKQVIKKENSNKPSVDLTVYTISSNDTERWDKVRQVETEDAVYLISVKEVASSEEVFSLLQMALLWGLELVKKKLNNLTII